MKAEEIFFQSLYHLLIGASKSKVDKVMNQFKAANNEFAEQQNKELIEYHNKSIDNIAVYFSKKNPRPTKWSNDILEFILNNKQ